MAKQLNYINLPDVRTNSKPIWNLYPIVVSFETSTLIMCSVRRLRSLSSSNITFVWLNWFTCKINNVPLIISSECRRLGDAVLSCWSAYLTKYEKLNNIKIITEISIRNHDLLQQPQIRNFGTSVGRYLNPEHISSVLKKTLHTYRL